MNGLINKNIVDHTIINIKAVDKKIEVNIIYIISRAWNIDDIFEAIIHFPFSTYYCYLTAILTQYL